MKIINIIGVRASKKTLSLLDNNEIKYTTIPDHNVSSTNHVVFNIEEDHDKYADIIKSLAGSTYSSNFSTLFEDREKRQAKYLRLNPTWYYQYPQPAKDFGFLDCTYDLKDFCRVCGSGKIQRAPFRFKKEPKWLGGKMQFIQLNWIYDEFFMEPSAYDKYFLERGIECREVLHHGTSKPLKNVVQLDIPVQKDLKADIDDFNQIPCAECGRIKLNYNGRGMFPALSDVPRSDLCKADFIIGGGGLSASHPVIISQALYSIICENDLKGVMGLPINPNIKK